MALAAPVADNWGIQIWWIIGGLACVFMGLISLFIPAVMHIEEEGYGPTIPLSVIEAVVAD